MKTLITALLATTLMVSFTVKANDDLNVKKSTEFAMQENVQKLNQQLNLQLVKDIQESLYFISMPNRTLPKGLLVKENTKKTLDNDKNSEE